MAHNPYHVDSAYDINAQSNQPDNNYIKDDLGYDFSKTKEGEDNKFGKFFDPYDNQKEQFANQGNALQQAYSNDQQKFLTQGTQQQLGDLTNNQQNTGFSGSGAIERNNANSREQIMRGYNQGMTGINFDRANQKLGLQEEVYGLREGYKEDQRNVMLDLIQSDAKIDRYSNDYEGDYWDAEKESEQSRRSTLPNTSSFDEGQTITQNGYEYTLTSGQWGTGRKVGD